MALAALAAFGCSGEREGSDAGGGVGGVSGFIEDPKCTPGTFGVSGRIYGEGIVTRVDPMTTHTLDSGSLVAAIEGGGELHVTWASGTQGLALSGPLRFPGDASHPPVDWCADPKSKLTLSGTVGTIELYAAKQACPPPPPPPPPGEPPPPPPPAPATWDMRACFDVSP